MKDLRAITWAKCLRMLSKTLLMNSQEITTELASANNRYVKATAENRQETEQEEACWKKQRKGANRKGTAIEGSEERVNYRGNRTHSHGP